MIQKPSFFLTFVLLFMLLNTSLIQSQTINGVEEPNHAVFSRGRLAVDDLNIEMPAKVEKGKEVSIHFRFKNISHRRLKDGSGTFTFIVNGTPVDVHFASGQASLNYTFKESFISIYCDDFRYQQEIKSAPVWLFAAPGFAVVLIAVVVNRRRKRKKESNKTV
jgi:hypothetical protein